MHVLLVKCLNYVWMLISHNLDFSCKCWSEVHASEHLHWHWVDTELSLFMLLWQPSLTSHMYIQYTVHTYSTVHTIKVVVLLLSQIMYSTAKDVHLYLVLLGHTERHTVQSSSSGKGLRSENIFNAQFIMTFHIIIS